MSVIKQESSSILLREDRGPVAILTLNRPDKLNALSNELIAGIMNALNSIELDSSVRVVVITGAGRAFSAGADIAAFQKHMQAGPADRRYALHAPWPSDDPARGILPQADYRGGQWNCVRRGMRTDGIYSHRACGGDRYILEGRD